MSRRVYGWGIVDKNGKPFWGEACVCEHRAPMDEQVNGLNDPTYDEEGRPFRVVRLYFESRSE